MGITLTATLALGLFYSWTSRLNGIYFFGRSLSPELKKSVTARAITRRYQTSLIVAMLVAGALSAMAAFWAPQLIMVGPLSLAFSYWFVFARANREARALQATEPVASRSVVAIDLDPVSSPWIPGWTSVLLPIALAALIFGGGVLAAGHGLGLAAGWEHLMQRKDSDYLSGLMGLSLGMLTSASVLLCLLKTSVRLRSRMAQYSLRASVVLQWVSLALMLTTTLLSNTGLVVPRGLGRGLVLASVLLVLAFGIWNQKRSSQFLPPAAELGQDDRWRWGLFYADKQDPALFVQSRCGTGYSLNYGRVLAWPIALSMVIYVLSLAYRIPR